MLCLGASQEPSPRDRAPHEESQGSYTQEGHPREAASRRSGGACLAWDWRRSEAARIVGDVASRRGAFADWTRVSGELDSEGLGHERALNG